MKIKCRDHQWVEWEGDVVCSGCNRVYQTKDDELPHFAPMVCECGMKLMPDVVVPDGVRYPTGGDTRRGKKKQKFSARACCPECFERQTSVQLIH